MAIQSIDATYLEIPLPAAFHPSWVPGLVMEHNRCLVVQVHDDSGHTGIGAGTVFERKQAELGAYVAVETVGRFLTGADPFEIEKHAELIARFGLLIGGRPWPLECALWDLMAKIAGVPLYKLLGGSRDRIRLYCSFGESLLTKNVESRLAAIDARRAEGFTAFKLRSRSADYRDDARMLETVRAHVGDDVELMVDCNQGWNLSPLGVTWSFEHAREFCLAAEASGLRWVEEPRSRFDFDGLARLRSEAGVPIAGGELNQGLHEFQILLDHGCLDKLQPDVCLAGGTAMARKVAALCETRSVGFSPHTWTNGIGLLHNLHLACGVPNCDILEYPYEAPGWVPEARDAMLVDPPRPVDGVLAVPQAPGIGCALDADAMERFGTKLTSS
jgi:L-alanine-DL-glutamate epimerase-like enolase superfamily enzyme